MLIQIFITISISVSFLVMGTAMKHTSEFDFIVLCSKRILQNGQCLIKINSLINMYFMLTKMYLHATNIMENLLLHLTHNCHHALHRTETPVGGYSSPVLTQTAFGSFILTAASFTGTEACIWAQSSKALSRRCQCELCTTHSSLGYEFK